jgi:hypothetical protein
MLRLLISVGLHVLDLAALRGVLRLEPGDLPSLKPNISDRREECHASWRQVKLYGQAEATG